MKRILFLLFSLIAITSQAQVSLGGYIQPLNNSSYPVQIDSLGKGGYMVARDTTARNDIPCLRRKYGMAVYSQAQQKLYILKDSNCVNTWVEFSGSAYINTTQINDTSYYISRSDGTKDTFLFTGGGGTASGQYIDSLKRSRDSVYGRINNVFRFQYKDSIGKGTQDLQSVLNNGNTTYDGQYISLIDTTDGNDLETLVYPSYFYTYDFEFATNYQSSRISFGQKYSDSGLLGTVLKRSRNSYNNNIYLPSNKINRTDTIATLADVRTGGGVTSVGSGYGIANSPTTITSTGSVIVDTSTSGLSGKYLRIIDTTAMLSKYLRKTDTASLSNRINLKLSIADTSAMLTPYLRKVDTASISNRINLKLAISDTSAMLTPYLRKIDSSRWVSSITRTPGKDSIIFFKNGDRFAIKDSVGTNPAPVGYYGAFQDTTTQTAASINTAYAVKLNTTDLTNGVSVVNDGSGNPTKIRLANTGIYNIQFSLQLEKTGSSGNMTADIWLRKNSVDIPSTTGKVVLTGSANASPVIAAWNYVLDLTAGDSIQLMWAVSNTNVAIIAASATSPHPSIPSVILTVTQQSGIMAGTGITAINSLTGAAQTMVVDSSNSTFKITSTGTSHTFTIPNASTSGVTRGLISNTDYTTFNNKIGASDTAAMLTPYLRKVDTASLSSRINLKLAISDTSTMLSKYLRKIDTASLSSRINLKVSISDTAAMLTPYLRKVDTASLSNRINLKLAISDTAAMLAPYTRQRDTIPMFVFGAGSGAAGDTSAFSTSALYGSFYNNGSDTILVTSLQIGLQGTSPSINATVYFNDSLAVTAGATKLVNAGSTATNIYTGTTVSSFDNTKIPPGNWVWVQTGTVTTKPTFFVLTLIGYKIRR